MGHSIEAWNSALQQQMPRGLAWPTDVSGRLSKYVSGYAPRLQRLEEKIDGLMSEMRPETTVELLSEWEVFLGLPDCTYQPGSNFESRRRAVVEKYRRKGGLQSWNIEKLAADLGFDIVVTETFPHHCLRPCTYPLWEQRFRDVLRIVVSGIPTSYMTCLDDVLTPLLSMSGAELECTLNSYKLAGKYYDFFYV